MKTDFQPTDRTFAGSRPKSSRASAPTRPASYDRYWEHDDPSMQQELCRRVRLFLEGSNMPALRYIRVAVDGDTLKLSGQVRTYYEKQLAVKLSGRVAGVIRVVDQIEVRGLAPAVTVGHLDSWHRDQPAAARFP